MQQQIELNSVGSFITRCLTLVYPLFTPCVTLVWPLYDPCVTVLDLVNTVREVINTRILHASQPPQNSIEYRPFRTPIRVSAGARCSFEPRLSRHEGRTCEAIPVERYGLVRLYQWNWWAIPAGQDGLVKLQGCSFQCRPLSHPCVQGCSTNSILVQGC